MMARRENLCPVRALLLRQLSDAGCVRGLAVLSAWAVLSIHNRLQCWVRLAVLLCSSESRILISATLSAFRSASAISNVYRLTILAVAAGRASLAVIASAIACLDIARDCLDPDTWMWVAIAIPKHLTSACSRNIARGRPAGPQREKSLYLVAKPSDAVV